MVNGQINKLLEFANMQVAAEAFLSQAGDPTPNVPPPEAVKPRLEIGNTHASTFTPVQAQQFTTQYEVLRQYRNDPQQAGGTGFSGTVFQSKTNPGEYTLSIHSTEFIDDAVRDSMSTNQLEIKDLGWAFGQILKIKKTHASLIQDGAQ